MKKMFAGILSGIMLLSCLTGCAVQQPKTTNNNVKTESSQSTVSEQAYESGKPMSAEEQVKEEKERKEAITQQYSIYNEFGLNYDSEKDRFFYEEKMVRYFSDKVSENNTNAFFYAEGTIDLNPVRDTYGNLIGLTVAADDEFAARTTKQVEMETEFQTAGVTNATESFELGEPNVKDDTLDAYSKYGVSFDTSTKKWVYDGQEIHFFYDGDNNTTYIDNDTTSALNLKVTHDKAGKIEKLEKITDAEMKKIMN